MLFNKGAEDYEVVREGEDTTLRFNMDASTHYPSIEDEPAVMAKVIDKLGEVTDATKVVLTQKRDYEYDYPQTRMLSELARLYNHIAKRKDSFGYKAFGIDGQSRTKDQRYVEIQNIIANLLKSDPIGAYVELKRVIRRARISLQKSIDEKQTESEQKFINMVSELIDLLEKTRLITIAQPYLPGYKISDRAVYRKIFSPFIKPDFMFTKLMANFPQDAEELDNYRVNETEVTIFEMPDNVMYLYHIMPPEFRLTEEEYEVLDSARKIMAEHKPKKSEFVNPERMRQIFENVGHDLLEEIAIHKGITMDDKQLDTLAAILVRYTVGFGLVEVLLQDENIQDVSINSPMGQIPIFIVHGVYGDCLTNIIPTPSEAESWASKLRMISGRPLDEANPLLDTDLSIPGATARVSTIAKPLDPTGLAFSFRRHRDNPWTLPLFIKNGMLNPLAAGLISFLIDGTRAILIAGTRGSGKSSLLSSLLVEIMRRYRIITVEDTLELPTGSMRKLGFNIQPMKVASALSVSSSEMSASDGIRSTLRLGDSALIVGEVRSTEATALYEAMRVGAAANVVAGTIHGDSPYGVFDRVVNDIGVPKTSFKATDIVIIANPVRSADGLHKFRRVIQITEVRKNWEEDPMVEGGFVDLMKYNPESDQLETTDDLMNGDSDILKMIASGVKEWAGNWDAVWDNIMLRANIKERLVEISKELKDPDMLEAEFVIFANDKFHKISEKVQAEKGSLDSKEIFFQWNEWLKREGKKRQQKTV